MLAAGLRGDDASGNLRVPDGPDDRADLDPAGVTV
jgi:hypothetical protein